MMHIEAIRNYTPINHQESNDQRIILDFIDMFGHDVLTRKNEIAHLTSSGIILNDSMTKMLMIHHNIYKTWTWTGGHTDGESDLLAVSVKEAVEETGVKRIVPLMREIASIDIIPVYGHMKQDKFVSSHLHLNISYILLADENEGTIVNTNETSGVQWVDINMISTFSNEPYLVEIYNKLIKKAKKIRGLHE